MAPLKLVYFDIAGRAEMIRLALHVGGVDFEDVRVGREEFAKQKEAGAYPWGQLPVLEMEGGKVVGQSTAIARYAGRLSGLYPEDPMAALLVDEVMCAMEDMYVPLGASMREPDPDKKAKLREELASVTLPRWLRLLEAKMQDNGPGPFCTGDKMTVADLELLSFLTWVSSGILDGIPTTILEPFHRTTTLMDKVREHPKVAEWYQLHPPKK